MSDTNLPQTGLVSQEDSYESRIQALKAEGMNKSQVARTLKINRQTVMKYWGDGDAFVSTSTLPEYQELGEAVVARKPDVGRIVTMGGLLSRKFLFNPRRVGAILQRFFEAAQDDNKVLLKYMDILLPQTQGSQGVMVNVQTNVTIDPTKKYDLQGNVIEPSTRNDPS